MKKLYSFLVSLLVIPLSTTIGLGSLYFYSELLLFTEEAKATNWKAFKLNFDKGRRYINKGEYQKGVDAFNKVPSVPLEASSVLIWNRTFASTSCKVIPAPLVLPLKTISLNSLDEPITALVVPISILPLSSIRIRSDPTVWKASFAAD